jgi:hypothetical protein
MEQRLRLQRTDSFYEAERFCERSPVSSFWIASSSISPPGDIGI